MNKTRKTFHINGANPISSTNYFRQLSEKRRFKYELVYGHCAQKIIEYIDPYSLKITVLREPIDRIVSHYYYAKSNPNHYLHKQIVKFYKLS